MGIVLIYVSFVGKTTSVLALIGRMIVLAKKVRKIYFKIKKKLYLTDSKRKIFLFFFIFTEPKIKATISVEHDDDEDFIIHSVDGGTKSDLDKIHGDPNIEAPDDSGSEESLSNQFLLIVITIVSLFSRDYIHD